MRCGLNILKGKPLTTSYFYSSQIQKIVNQEECDLILVDCSSMAPYVEEVKKTKKLLIFVDVDSDKWRIYSEKTGFPLSMIYRREYKLLCMYEEKLLREFNASIVISDNECKFLPSSKKLFVVRNGIDFEYFKPHKPVLNNTIIFTGAMNYFPNVDGVCFFAREIFPKIRQRLPSVKFVIAGMDPAPSIQRLACGPYHCYRKSS